MDATLFLSKMLELQDEFHPCKFSREDAHGWWDYVWHYKYAYCDQLHKKAERIKKVLEIGVQGGGSIKMWEKLFDAEVHGIDCYDFREHAGGNRHVHVGLQGDVGFLEREIIPHGPFDLIIDDGGHVAVDQVISFRTLWPHVSPGGVYLIEDLGMNYDWPNNYSCMEYLKNGVDSVNIVYNVKPTIPDLDSIHFYSAMCWMHKKSPRLD